MNLLLSKISIKFCSQHLGQMDRTIKVTCIYRSITCRLSLGWKEIINQDLSKQGVRKGQKHSGKFPFVRGRVSGMYLLVCRGNGNLKKKLSSRMSKDLRLYMAWKVVMGIGDKWILSNYYKIMGLHLSYWCSTLGNHWVNGRWIMLKAVSFEIHYSLR